MAEGRQQAGAWVEDAYVGIAKGIVGERQLFICFPQINCPRKKLRILPKTAGCD